MSRLIQSENIVKALVYTDRNFEDKPAPLDSTTLLYNKIYPFTKVPKITDKADTFITMKFGYKPDGAFYKLNIIYFYAITHISLVNTNYGLRYDYLINQIDMLFNSQRGIGIGKLPFHEMSDFAVNDNWIGSYIGYRSTEFN